MNINQPYLNNMKHRDVNMNHRAILTQAKARQNRTRYTEFKPLRRGPQSTEECVHKASLRPLKLNYIVN